MPWKTFFSNAGSKDGKKKKNKSLSSAAKVRVHNQTPRTNSYGVTQADVDEVQSGRIRTTQRKQESERETAPAPTTGVGRLGAKNKYAGQMAMTGTTTYFEEEKRASERLKERGVSTYHDVKGEGVPSSRINSSGKIRNKTSAGTRKTYKNPDGSVGYYYEKPDHGFKSQRQYHETGDERYLTGETGKKPVASGIKSKFGIDRSERFYTQESPNTLKYDDGKKTEYYERQGDRYVSVPEERYNQVRLLNSGRNPSDYSFDKRAADRAKAAGQNIKAAVKGVGVSTNVGRENKGYQLAMQYMDGKNLSEKQESFMRGTKAGQAVLKGDYRTARELVNQETRERQLAEQGVLREQEKANMRAEISKIGASKPAQFALDVGGTTLEMAPGMAMNAVAPGTFLAEMAFQSYGNSYNNARLQGASHNEAVISGMQNAAVETLSEMMFAGGKTLGKMTGVKGIFHPGKEIEDASLAFIKTTAGRDVVRTAQKLGLASAEEGAEELVAGIVEPVMDNLIYQHEDMNSEWWQQTIHDALYNTLVGAAMGGGFGTADVVQSYRAGEAIRENADVANMINTGLSMPEDSASYMLAKRLNVQTRNNPEMLGNIDTAELSAALNKDMQKVQESHDKEMKTTKRALAKKGLENVQTHAEMDYMTARNAEDAVDAGEITSDMAENYHSKLGDTFGEIYERARDAIASKIQRAPSVEATEEDVEAMYEEAQSEAVSPARSIARILTGEGTAVDTANLMASNPAARETFEEISGQALPASNAETITVLNRINATNNLVNTEQQAADEQDRERKYAVRTVVEDARRLLGHDNKAVTTFYQMTDSIATEDLDAAKEGFVALWDLGNRSESMSDFVPNMNENARLLTVEQQMIAFKEGLDARQTEYENAVASVTRAQERRDAEKKTNTPAKKKEHKGVADKLTEDEKKQAGDAVEKANELNKALGVNIVLESARTVEELDSTVADPSSINGWYSGGVVHVNIDGDSPFEVVFSHEFTHHLEKYAPKEYQKLIDFIKNAKAKNNEAAWRRMIDAKMNEYAAHGVKLKSRDDAVREIVADMAYEFLNDERAMHQLFGYDANLASEIRNVILDIINKMLAAIKGKVVKGSQWKGMEDELKEARKMWLDAAEVAKENAELDLGESGMQLEISKKFYNQFDNWDGKTTGFAFTVGMTSAPVQEAIRVLNSKYNAGIKEGRRPIKWHATNVIRTIGKHDGMTKEVARELPKLLDDPRIIIRSKNEATPNRFLLIGDLTDAKGNLVTAVLEPQPISAKGNALDWVVLVSSQGRHNINGLLANSEILFEDKKRINEWLNVNGLQLPVRSSTIDSNNIVDEEAQSRNQNTQKEQKQPSLSSLGMTEQNGIAAWLPERIDDLMQRYGGTGNYSQAWAVMMNPRDFLKLTLSDDQLDRWSSSAQNVPGEVQGMPYREAVDRVWNRAKETGEWIHDNENYPLDQEELASNEQTPFISIYEDSAGRIHVDGHEGRHRMRALMEAGITSVPVVVKDLSTKYSKTNIDSMTLGSQDFGRGPVNSNASVTVTDLVPIRRDNRDELMEKFGAKGDEQVQFSISVDSTGRQLTKGQQEYFKNSKARDEQGRLVPVYHSTEYGGFTIFDPNASDDGRSLFFTSSRKMSESYTKKKGTDINPYETGNQTPLEEANDLDEAIKRLKEVEERGAAYVEVRVPASDADVDRRENYTEIMHPGPDEILLDYMTLSDYLTDYPLSEYPNGPEGMRLMIRDSKTDWIHADMGDLSDLAEGYNDYAMDYNYESNVDPYESRDIQGTYSAYLNLENPLIIDAAGQRWDNFSDNGVSVRGYSVQEDENGREGVTLFLFDDEYDGGQFYTFDELKSQYNIPQKEVDRMLDEGHGEIGLRNNQYYDLEENGFPEMGNTRSWSEYAAENGYDGVIVRNLHDNGVYGVSNEAGDVYIAFSSNQVKDIRNENPTDDPDIRYSLSEDTNGRTLTAAQRDFFKDSKIRDEQGRLKVMYHGTNNEFTVFDFSQGGKNGTAEGYGIYTSDREDVSRHYGGRLIEGYVNITRPAASDQKTIKRSELKKLIKATVDAEAQRLAEDYDGDVAAAAKDTWISNYTYTYDKSLDAAIDEVAGTILDLNDNDMDIVQEVMGGMAIRDYNEAERFYDVLTDVTGIDGFVTDWEDSNTGESSQIALAFRSNQIKNVTNENPTANPDIRYSISTPMSELDHTDKTVADSNGNPVAKFDRAGGVQFSISTYEDKGRAVLNKYLDKMVLEGEMDQDEADQIRTEMEKIYDVCKDYADTGRYLPFTAWSNAEVITGANGRPIFSAVKNNSEYKMNMDFSTICKKRRTLDAIFNELVNRGFFDRFDLNKEDSAAFVVKMNDIIRKNGFEAACALCFVEARRYRQQQTAMTFRDMWNDLVKSMYKDESKISHFNFGRDDTARMVEDGIHTMKDSDLDLTYLKKVAKSKGVPSRAAKLLLEDPSQRKLMRTGDMMSSVGFENFQVQNPKLMKIYNAKKGTGGAKSSFGDVQYFHEIIGSRNKTFNRNKAYKVGGVRIQSFSDYVPRMVFDYVEMVADLAAKRLPAHAYTKEALFAKQFGLTGIKINLSLVPDVIKGAKVVGLDKDGNYAWNVEGTFPYDEAEKLIHAEGYKENVGTIAVGVSDKQIMKMLADPNIMMVIPYHKSSLNPIVAEMTNVDAFTDYTDFQNTKDETGKTVKRDFDWDGKLHKLSHGKDGKLLPKEQWGDIQDVVKEYADWCKARNYTPKFSQFLYMEDGSINPGYYKMLEDFSLLSVDGEFTPQDDVRMKFPTEADAFGSMADLIAEGLDADAVLEGKRSKKVVPIADEIEELAESGELLSNLNQRDVDIVKNFMETTDITKGHAPQFSIASDRDREIADLQRKVDRLKRDKRRTYGREAKEGDAVRVAKAILRDTSSDYSLNQTIKGIKNVFQMIRRGDDFSEIYGELQGLARSIADSSYDMVEIPGAREDAELRQRFLDTRKRNGGSPLKILIPQNLVGDFDRVGGWKEFRAAHKGIVTLSVNSGESYDTFVDSIAEEFGEQYRAVGDNSGIDSLIKIIETADSQEARNPERKVYKDEDLTGEIPDDVDMGIMGGWRDEEVNSIIDRLLDDINTEIMPDLTFADRKAAEKDEAVRRSVNREREKWEARREKWKADRDKRIAEMKEDKKLAVEAQRAEGKERLRKQAEMYRRQREKSQQRRAETASRRKLLNHINRTAQRLSQKLLKPTDNQHIPEKYRKAVADMLGWLDFENARTDQWAKRHGNVPSERILNMRKLKDIYAKIADDEQLNKYIEPDDQINEWLDFLSDIEGSRLDDLDTEQLKTVRLVLDAVSWQVNNADKALTEGLKQNRADIATQLMNELEAQKGEKLSDGMLKKFIKADSTPVHFFDRLGLNTLKTIYKELTVAQDKHIKNLSEAQDYIEKNITSKFGNTRKVGPNNSLIKKWTEEAQKYKLENGKTVEMTGAQVMSLYALNKREQARKHLLGGGIVIAPTKVKRNLKGGIKEYLLERELQKTRAELSYADITSILSKMSQEQIDAAEAMLKYLKTTSEWGNETSMKLYGYRKFTEENYFPIQSAKEFIAGSNLELQRDKKIKNQGMTKQVNEYANNPIVIDDFFEVTTAHINQMSQYNSFVPILEDFDKIYQYNEYDPDTKKYHRSVKELIEQKHGRWAADYIETLMKNVNGNYGNEVADIQGFDKLLRNWKAAKIGLSIRVLAQQPTAVVRAFNEIDPKYFVGTPKRHSHKRMWEICPIAEWKHWGYSQTDIHRSMRDTMMGDKHLSDKLFFDMYGMADDLGWGMIFDAVERETKALMKKGKLKFKYDDADYRKHVNERFRQIVDRTQVVDSVLHRSQYMRSQNTLTKAMTAFMAEPTISVNTIMTAFTKAQEEARAGHKAAAAKAATRGVAVFVANAVAVSAAASLISAIRESYLPDDDDDDEEKELSAIQQWLVDHGVEEGSLLYSWMTGYFIEDFKDNINPLMMIPVAKDMLNMWQGYEAPNPMYQLPQSLIQTTQNMKKWIDEDGNTRYSGRYYIERTAESVAELFGLPAANIRKELIGIQNIYFRAISEKDYGDYLQDRWELNEDYKSNKNVFIDHYLNAKKTGHNESAKDIKHQLLQSNARDEDGNKIFTEDAIQKRAWSVYAPNYKDDVIAGKDVSKQEKNLKSVGISQEDIDDKKSKALVSAISDAVENGDISRLDSLRKSLSKYGYDDYDIDKKIKSSAYDLMYDAIDAKNYNDAETYIKIITDGTDYTRDDIVSSITTHYMSEYYESMDAGDDNGVDRVRSILKKYGVSKSTIKEKEAEHYKDYYRQKAYMAYASGDTDEAYRIADLYCGRYPGAYAKGAYGMMYGLEHLSDETVKRYTAGGKYDEWEIPW